MNQNILSSLEIDAIGEIINISLGASATAISTMLSSRVEITVPRVKVESYENFEFRNLEPAIAVTIDYVEGISGSNIMILKKEDIRVILETLMQTEYDPETFELDEIGISAVCEVMNQMMGASSTALSELLGRVINISTPTTFEVTDVNSFKDRNFKPGEHFVVIEFDLSIEGKLKSEFINVMPMQLVKEMVATFMGDMYIEDESGQAVAVGASAPTPQPEEPTQSAPSEGGVMSQEAIEAMLRQGIEEEKAPEKESSSSMMSQEEIEALLSQSQGEAVVKDEVPMPISGSNLTQEAIEALLSSNMGDAAPAAPSAPVQPARPTPAAPVQSAQAPAQTAPAQPQAPVAQARYESSEPKVIDVRDTVAEKMHLTGQPKKENLDMIMDVPLVVSVEIGRTKKPLKEILEITQGSLIVLDKMAGDQVELYANNKCIAKGDVVVVHDNFGIRITEVMGKN